MKFNLVIAQLCHMRETARLQVDEFEKKREYGRLKISQEWLTQTTEAIRILEDGRSQITDDKSENNVLPQMNADGKGKES